MRCVAENGMVIFDVMKTVTDPMSGYPCDVTETIIMSVDRAKELFDKLASVINMARLQAHTSTAARIKKLRDELTALEAKS